jgi:uncharacterized protein YfaS (alpha-2-macroglobulin family)
MNAYVLALYNRADAGLNERLFEQRNFLPVYAKSFLLRALFKESQNSTGNQEQTKEQIKTVVKELTEAATVQNNSAFITDKSSIYYLMSSSVRTTAMVTSALIEVGADRTFIEKLIAGLVKNRGTGGRYSNTQENVYALIAFADFIAGEKEGAANVKVIYNSKTLFDSTVSGQKIISLKMPLQGTSPGILKIESQDRLFVNATLLLKRKQKESEQFNNGITVKREYLDLETLQPVTRCNIGRLIKVRLTVNSQSTADYLAIDDPFPSGLEPVNTSFATEDHSLEYSAKQSYQWDYTEQRDDRMLAFANKISSGEKIIEYLLRATSKGTFNAPPASASLMYTPSVAGRSSAVTFQVEK